MLHLRSITPRILVDSSQGFPFDVPVIQSFHGMTFAHEVTFFVGENGSGKSTLLEAIACAAGMVSVGAEELSRDHTLAQLQRLANSFKLVWTKKTNKGFFLRSEDFFSFAKRIAAIKEALESDVQDVDRDYADRSDHARGLAKMAYLRELAALRAFYGDGLDAQSHGESFFKLFRSRFKPGGLYLLDEPEAPLSPMHQIIFLSMLRTMVRQDAQFIIATHSPGQLHLKSEDFEQIGFAPASLEAFAIESDFGRGFLVEQIERNMAQDGKILGTVANTLTLVIFAEGEIEYPM